MYHGGPSRANDKTLRTRGGRVLAVTAVAPTFAEAQTRSRDAAASIGFEGAIYRRDIGWREAERRDVAMRVLHADANEVEARRAATVDASGDAGTS